MTPDRVERRLTAVLAADVAGYSRLMGADEEGTLDALKAHRRALVEPTLRKRLEGRARDWASAGMVRPRPAFISSERVCDKVTGWMRAYSVVAFFERQELQPGKIKSFCLSAAARRDALQRLRRAFASLATMSPHPPQSSAITIVAYAA